MAAPRAQSTFKCCLLGASGAGKSSLALRFSRNEFSSVVDATVGAAYVTKTLQLPTADVKVELWDTAGQERYRSLAPMYYRGAQAAIVVYDVTSQDSFEAAKAWIKELKKKMEPGVVLALVANKVDLGPGMRRIEADEGRLCASENGLLYAETSAKTALNVHELFMEIARRVPMVPSAGPPGSAGAGRRSGVNLSEPAGAAAGGAGRAGSGGGGGGGCCGS